jgi:hypothetical protein
MESIRMDTQVFYCPRDPHGSIPARVFARIEAVRNQQQAVELATQAHGRELRRLPWRIGLVLMATLTVTTGLFGQTALGIESLIDFVPITSVDTGAVVGPGSLLRVVYLPVSAVAKSSAPTLASPSYSLTYTSLDGKTTSEPLKPSSMGPFGILFLFTIPNNTSSGSYVLALSGPAYMVAPQTTFSVFTSRDLATGRRPTPESIDARVRGHFDVYGTFPVSSDNSTTNFGVFVLDANNNLAYYDPPGLGAAFGNSPVLNVLHVPKNFPSGGAVIIVTRTDTTLYAATASVSITAPSPRLGARPHTAEPVVR